MPWLGGFMEEHIIAGIKDFIESEWGAFEAHFQGDPTLKKEIEADLGIEE